MDLRRFNKEGLIAFQHLLDDPDHKLFDQDRGRLLLSPLETEVLDGQVEFTPERLASRFAVAEYLSTAVKDSGVEDIVHDAGLWSWLACVAFDQVCGRSRTGWNPGERARWILEPTNYQRYYRHLLAGPYHIYRCHREHPEIALAVLCNPIDKPGDVVGQLASRQEYITNANVMEAATTLYVDAETRNLKRGAQSKGKGAARRLAEVLQQFDLTWDLFEMKSHEIIDLLPDEFSRFRPEPVDQATS